MVMETFGTCKWFLHLPYISSAGWVGTVMHGKIARMGKQRQNNGTSEVAGPGGTGCNTERSEKIWRAQQNNTYTSHDVLRNISTVRRWSKKYLKREMS
jgi:hypothetical protein